MSTHNKTYKIPALTITLIVISTILMVISVYDLSDSKKRSPEFTTLRPANNEELALQSDERIITVLSDQHVERIAGTELPEADILRINLQPDPPYNSFSNCSFVIHSGAELEGWSFSIGMSPTNDGWGGDSGSSHYDSELNIYENELYIYLNDYYESELLLRENGSFWDREGILEEGQQLMITVSNNQIILVPSGDKALPVSHPGLFCIDAEKAQQGRYQHTLYAGINRVIHPRRTDRRGTGVEYVEISMNYSIKNRNTYSVFLLEDERKTLSGFNLSLFQIPAGRAPLENVWYRITDEKDYGIIWLSVHSENPVAEFLKSEDCYFTESIFNKSNIQIKRR